MNKREKEELRKKAKPVGATRKIISKFAGNIYFIDLIDFSSKESSFVKECKEISKTFKPVSKNEGYNYVLVVVDAYSRYIMIKPLKKKTGDEVSKAMVDIIKKNKVPNFICCDYGKEFLNNTFKNEVLEKFDIKMYHGHSEQKAVLAESSIRILKDMIREDYIESNGNWKKSIQKAVNDYNSKVKRSTGFSPNEIFIENNQYTEPTEPLGMQVEDITPQFEIGDYVRIYKIIPILHKKSLNNKWSTELFKVEEIDSSYNPIMYKLEGKDRKYYHWQLLKSDCKPVEKPARQERIVTRSVTKSETRKQQDSKVKTRNKRTDYSKYRFLNINFKR